MVSVFDSLRELTILSVTLRLILATICGGFIGIERTLKRRPAGFRTHILICMGASITTMTSQYLFLEMNYYTDVARLGAQVISGIGFLGAGTILVTKRRRVKGLTTAAGLWTSGIIGLCFGCGYFEGGLIATFLVVITELMFSRLEYRLLKSAPEVNLFIKCSRKDSIDHIMSLCRGKNVRIAGMEITREKASMEHNVCALVTLRFGKHSSVDSLISNITAIDGVVAVEEM